MPEINIRLDGPDYAYWFARNYWPDVIGEAYQSHGTWFAFIRDGHFYGYGATVEAAVNDSLQKWQAVNVPSK